MKNSYFCNWIYLNNMKKIAALFSATVLVMCAMLFSSCDKHAFSISDNKFEYVRNDVPVNHIGDTFKISQGETIYLYASSPEHARINGGDYTVETTDSDILGVAVVSWGGDKCVSVTGKTEGTASVTIHFLWRGFDLHKSISFTVQAAE